MPSRHWRLLRRSRAGFASVASNHRWPAALQSSAIIGCSESPEHRPHTSGGRMKLVRDVSIAAADIDGLLIEMRPRLHRYCARMIGSVIDGGARLQDGVL